MTAHKRHDRISQWVVQLKAPANHRAARWIVGLVVVGALGLSATTLWGHQRLWWMELVRYVPYPIHLVVVLGATAVSLRLGWRWRAAALLASVLVPAVIMEPAWGRGDTGSHRVRVMTYNIKAYLAVARTDGYSRIAWEVLQADPDILVLQDAKHLIDPDEEVPPPMRAVLRDRQVYANREYVVVSRFPLRDCAAHDSPYGDEQDGYVRCALTVSGTTVDLVAVHFLSPRDGLNATRRLGRFDHWEHNFMHRLSQADKLADDIVAMPRRPLIVAGDLNAPEGSPIVGTLLDTGLRDAFSAAGQGWGYTHGHALRPGISFLRIDHILVSGSLGVRNCYVGGKEGSEHRPVIADLLLTRD